MALGPIAPGKFGKGESDATSDNLYYVTFEPMLERLTRKCLRLRGEATETLPEFPNSHAGGTTVSAAVFAR